jgi:CRP-like cAMP-binding protein
MPAASEVHMIDVSSPKESWRRLLTGAESAWLEIDRAVLEGVVHARYAAGRTLLARTVKPKVVCRIQEGLIKLLYRVPDGDDVVIGVRGPGRMIGLESALMMTPSQVTAVALTDCHVTEIDRDSLLSRASENPALVIALFRMLSVEVRDQIERSALFASVPARRRLELLLAQFAHVLGTADGAGAIRMHVPLVQRELAEAIHVTPETLSRLLSDLERDALIERRHGRITMLTHILLSSIPSNGLDADQAYA